jgi:Tol biopolymer transport system component
MGEVYRARDTRLQRDVAIKVLPELFAADPDRLARFEREAQTLAALNHPNIAHIHGVIDSPAALVMELVEGDDLAQRIARGAIPLDELTPIARQIADALEAAHEQGIVHRDLKPANIKVRPDGTVKVLDFGLAKAMEPAAASSPPPLANSPTFTAPPHLRQGYDAGTQMGLVVGTAAYMAPEQARGKTVDRRADIWAFGCVLFEMLTGRHAFEGEEISDVLASVLKAEPMWAAIPAETPASLRRLLRRCLEKDPRKRLSSIGDARLELDEPDAPRSSATAAVTPATPVRRRATAFLWPAIACAAVAAAVVLALERPREPEAAPLRRFSLLPPPAATLYPDSTGVAISPDGSMVAFIVGDTVGSDTQLWVRSLDSLVARRLEDADGARLPFWSPDSRRIGFSAGQKLKAIPASGGRAQAIADINAGRGATWNAANVIVYAADVTGPLYRVDADGGTPAPVTTIPSEGGVQGHRFPSFLPDGDHFLYAAVPAHNGRFAIFVGSLSGGPPVTIGAMDTAPVYAEPGYLLYGRQGALIAQPFDATSLKLAGDPITLDDEPAAILDPRSAFTAGRAVSVSSNGTLAYYSEASRKTEAAWYDMSGRRQGTLPLPAGHYHKLKISPDGTRAVIVRSASPSEASLWVINDLTNGGVTQLSRGPGVNETPVWSPDSTRIVFSSDRDGASDFYIKVVGDAAPEQPFYRSPAIFKGPTAWSSDGTSIIFTQLDRGQGQNIYRLDANGSGTVQPIVNGPAREAVGVLSPDAHWIAFASDETGPFQLYVQPYPGPGPRVQISREGGGDVWWSPDGRQVLWATADLRALWRVDVTPGSKLTAGAPVRIATLPPGILSVDLTPDRQRLLALAPDTAASGSMTVVQHWRAALDKAR